MACCERMRTVTADAFLESDDGLILVNAALADIDIGMFTAVGNKKKRVTFIRIDDSEQAARVLGYLAQTINGSSGLNISDQYSTLTLVSDNANWLIENAKGNIELF